MQLSEMHGAGRVNSLVLDMHLIFDMHSEKFFVACFSLSKSQNYKSRSLWFLYGLETDHWTEDRLKNSLFLLRFYFKIPFNLLTTNVPII